MLWRLAIPGVIEAIIGAYLLTSLDSEMMKPVVAVYLLLMGFVIIRKANRKVIAFKKQPRRVHWLALFGGFVDASGGGGWGPLVTTTLVSAGNQPRTTIGSVNAAEFLVTLTASGIFTLLAGINNWPVIPEDGREGIISPTRTLTSMMQKKGNI